MNESSTKKIMLEGLCCPNCAGKIESMVRKLEGVKNAEIDFVSQKITVEAADNKLFPAILRQTSDIVKKIEPDIQVSLVEDTTSKDTTIKDSRDAAKRQLLKRILLITGTMIYLIGIITQLPGPVSLAVFLVSYVLVGGEVVLKAIRNISKGQIFDENFLMTIATIGAFLIGEYPEGVAVMLFYQIGEGLQKIAVNRSRRNITSLMDIRADFANIKEKNEIRQVSPEAVAIGDIIVVRPGEKVPLDGVVTEGHSSLDTSALTGEALPRDVAAGDEVLSGSINKNGLLTIKVTKVFTESTIAKILDLVQNASSKKAPTENFITKFARFYTPVVTFTALGLAVIPPLLIEGAVLGDWVYRALAFLVVSCPCALVISVPLSFFGGIGGASKNGILIKGGNYLEALNHIDTIVMDKTGTLTKGVFVVSSIYPSSKYEKKDILFYAAYAEYYSGHPISESIKKAYGKHIQQELISEHEEEPGYGIKTIVEGKTVLAGNHKMMEKYAVSYEPADHAAGTVVYLAIDGFFAGSIIIEDEVKPDSKSAVQQLKELGVRTTVMLTGDSKKAGEAVAGVLNIDRVYTELLPQDKVEKFERLQEEKQGKGRIVFVGDGINDAPVLARADIGIAMGALGSDAAIEAADVVLMTDEPSKIVTAIQIARKTRAIVWQNIIFSMVVKIIVLILAAIGVATMWEAVFGDVGVTVIAVFNSMRAMKVKEANEKKILRIQ